METPSITRSFWSVTGRVMLGLIVGASFGVVIGALIASWVYGVEAIEGEAVNASYLAAATTIIGAVIGAALGYRASSARPEMPHH